MNLWVVPFTTIDSADLSEEGGNGKKPRNA